MQIEGHGDQLLLELDFLDTQVAGLGLIAGNKVSDWGIVYRWHKAAKNKSPLVAVMMGDKERSMAPPSIQGTCSWWAGQTGTWNGKSNSLR